MLTVAFSHGKITSDFYFSPLLLMLPEFSLYNEHICFYIYKHQYSSIWEKRKKKQSNVCPYQINTIP